MQRREFLKSAASGAGLLILPSGTLFGQNAPSDKLNIALMGVWGRAIAHYNTLSTENVVAICDVNENRLAEGLKLFPNAKTYWDWRKCLDQKDIDAVIICTPDHHHAFIANWAMNRGKSVFCEKPMAISVEEARTLRANYIKNKSKIATQQGTQRHVFPNFARLRELILDGAIGELQTISGWDSRTAPQPRYPDGQGEPPPFFHYDQWLGPAPFHPYSPEYFAANSPGANCGQWNMYRDFGVGQMGDMGAHTMDLLWNAIDGSAPTAIEADQELSSPYDPNILPVKLKATFELPQNSWRGPVKVVWYQGGLKPNPPRNFMDLSRISNGAIFQGSKGVIFADFNSRLIIPDSDAGDMTYYKRRTKEELLPSIGASSPTGAVVRPMPSTRGGAPGGRGGASQGGRGGARAASSAGLTIDGRCCFTPEGFTSFEMLPGNVPPEMGVPNAQLEAAIAAAAAGRPPAGDRQDGLFQRQWIDACKGKYNGVQHGTSTKTSCDYDYSGSMMEQMLLGLVAHRAGKRLEYDPVAGRVTNAPEANDYLKRNYRQGWTLNG
jgi:predicted dehydrogenase